MLRPLVKYGTPLSSSRRLRAGTRRCRNASACPAASSAEISSPDRPSAAARSDRFRKHRRCHSEGGASPSPRLAPNPGRRLRNLLARAGDRLRAPICPWGDFWFLRRSRCNSSARMSFRGPAALPSAVVEKVAGPRNPVSARARPDAAAVLNTRPPRCRTGLVRGARRATRRRRVDSSVGARHPGMAGIQRRLLRNDRFTVCRHVSGSLQRNPR
jgi:hypothetical protein